jgi:hypothetical protein
MSPGELTRQNPDFTALTRTRYPAGKRLARVYSFPPELATDAE